MKSIKKFTGVSGNSSLVNPKENMKLRPARLADDALHELEQENKIAYVPGPYAEMAYQKYGVSYDIPIAKDPDKKYKSPHWLPVLIVDEVAQGLKKQ